MADPDRPDFATEAEKEAEAGATAYSEGPGPKRKGAQKCLEAGARAGRYLILDQLGRGGMGVVYQAYDPELDRRIALKVLSLEFLDPKETERARERLLREAKALAQLSHPNVVAAYDVGTVDDDVFVAMELVEGQNLKQWLAQTKPGWRQVVAVLLQAGRGIAAAHQIGLIHRDIKPDNIVIGKDGRARVLDFGLARAMAESVKPDAEQDLESDSSQSVEAESPGLGAAFSLSTPSGASGDFSSGGSHWRDPLTLAGVVLGTPGYLAPEQYLGDSLVAKSDQYSFGVTLYEALVGERPFRAKKARKLRARVMSGKINPPSPDAARVPARLRRIALRAFSLAKQDRYPSMDAMLAELAKDPRSFWRRLAVVFFMLLLVGASFFAASTWQAHKQRGCRGAELLLAGAWDDQVKQSVHKAFVATGRSYATQIYGRVEKILDQRAGEWVNTRTEVCAATHVRGEQSELLLDKRMHCLDRHLGEMRALTQLLAHNAQGEVVDKAVAAAHALSDLKDCDDAEALLAAVAMPSDKALQARLAKIRAQMGRVKALKTTGLYRQGSKLVSSLAEQLQKIDYAPLRAALFFEQAQLLMKANDSPAAEPILRAAIQAAAKARDDVLLAKLWTALVSNLADQRSYQGGILMSQVAAVAVERAGNDDLLRAELHRSRGRLYYEKGDYTQAYQHYFDALQLQERVLGANHPRTADTVILLGNVFFMQGKYQEARGLYQRAAEIQQKVLSAQHPEVARSIHNLGIVAYAQGDFEAARQSYLRASQIWDQALGPDNTESGHAYHHLGQAAAEQKDFEAAQTYAGRALRIFEQHYGRESHYVGNVLLTLGDAYLANKQYDKAQAHYQRSLDIFQKRGELDRYPAAGSYQGVGMCLLQTGQARSAIAFLEKSLAIRKAKTADSSIIAEAQFALARAKWQLGQGREALPLAREARLGYLKGTDRTRDELSEVDAWLAIHSKGH